MSANACDIRAHGHIDSTEDRSEGRTPHSTLQAIEKTPNRM